MRLHTTHIAKRTTPDVWETSPSGKRGQSRGARGRAVQSPFSGHVARRYAVMLCLVLVVVAGCGTACRCCRSGSSSIAAAPELVRIDGREYSLAASAWRDFQPIAPPDGQPLIVVVKVSPSDMMPLPSDLAIDRVWVLNGKKEWSAAPDDPGGREESPATRLEVSARNGPKWGPGIKVDVVVRLKQGKKTFLVRAAGVEIKRTD